MERLTKRGKGICVGLSACFDECDHIVSGCDCVRIRGAINRLAAYEDIGLEPDKITDLLYSAVKLIASMRNNKKAALWMEKYGEGKTGEH